MYANHVTHFVANGIAFVPINYRLAPSTTHPGQVADAYCALAWVHENADRYRLDPSHVVVMGGSAGGYLAGMLATADDPDTYLADCPHDLPQDPIAGVVPVYGFFDMTDLDDPAYPAAMAEGMAILTGEPYDQMSPDVLAAMSPIEQIDGSEPPVLAIHGINDLDVPPFTSERFVAALQDSGADAELLLVEGGHAFEVAPLTVPPNPEVLAAIGQFIDDVA